MKNYLKIFVIIITSTTISSNSSAQFTAYYPSGKKINIEFKTIKNLLDTLGIKESESHSNNIGMAYFKRLSNRPIFVMFLDKDYPLRVNEIINSYNYSKYINSYSYYHDLKDMIGKGTLTKSYLRDVFNEPDVKGENEDGTNYWIFKNYNAKITFKDSIAKNADVVNYKSIEKNQLAITQYSVTGSDYAIGFDISINNLAKKTIKYIFITVTATNPVDDKVGTKTVKAVGPIKTNDSGTYKFENLIYSKTAQYLGIDLIKVEFIDGTLKIITKPEIQKIKLQDWEEIGNRTVE